MFASPLFGRGRKTPWLQASDVTRSLARSALKSARSGAELSCPFRPRRAPQKVTILCFHSSAQRTALVSVTSMSAQTGCAGAKLVTARPPLPVNIGTELRKCGYRVDSAAPRRPEFLLSAQGSTPMVRLMGHMRSEHPQSPRKPKSITVTFRAKLERHEHQLFPKDSAIGSSGWSGVARQERVRNCAHLCATTHA